MFKPYHSLHFILTTAWDLYFCRLKKQGHSSFGIHWFSSRCCPSGQWHDGRLAKLQECSPFFVIIPQGRVQSDAFSLCWNPSGHTIAKIVWKLKIKNYNNKQKKDIFQINMRYFWKFNNLLMIFTKLGLWEWCRKALLSTYFSKFEQKIRIFKN